MLDQAIFIAMDLALDIGADKVSAAMKRIAAPMIAVTVVSAALDAGCTEREGRFAGLVFSR